MQRIAKAQQVLNKCDIALLVVDASVGLSEADKALWQQLQAKKLALHPCAEQSRTVRRNAPGTAHYGVHEAH